MSTSTTTETTTNHSNNDSSKSTPTVVKCRCGKVCMELANSRPQMWVECCCCDCRSLMNWCLQQQPPNDSNAKPWCQPSNLWYIDNDILKVDGEDQLYLFKLREGGATRRIMTKCCQTPLLGQHPFYLRNRVVIYPSLAQIEYADSKENPKTVDCRIQTKFWDEEKLGPLPKLAEGAVSVPSDSPAWFFKSGILPFMMHPAASKEGFTANALIDRLKLMETMEVLEIVEEVPPGCFRTGGGVLSLTFKNPFYRGGGANDTTKENGPGVVEKKEEEDSNIFEAE